MTAQISRDPRGGPNVLLLELPGDPAAALTSEEAMWPAYL